MLIVERISMTRRLIAAALALTVPIAGAVLAATPAHASDAYGYLCVLNQNTWLRDMPHGTVLRTLSAGRGFRVHGGSGEDNVIWHYGHGAEAPGLDGWIPGGNC
jgi:hypothetical protein